MDLIRRYLVPTIVLGLFGTPASAEDPPRPGTPEAFIQPIPLVRPPYDPSLVSKAVAFWEKRARDDPKGSIDLRELAGAYLARQRETGEIADAVLAEKAARRSLELLPRGNAAAMIRLARSLLSQHRFPEAKEVADRAASLDPQAHRLQADIALELGDYDEADRALAAIPEQADDLNLKALAARIFEINGKPDRSLALMREAARQADGLYDMPAESAAWYHTMIGHSLIDSGKLDDGERACREALAIVPGDYRAMTGMAEAATWRGDHQGAIDWGRKAIRLAPQNPEALRLIGDAQAAMGQTREADEQYRLLEVLAHSFPRIYDRHWVLFCADTGRDLDGALALARKDLELRHDIHAYDTLAWACFKKGLLPEADRMMEKALARGTQEAPLFHHAGTIAGAVGDRARADSFLARARALNPYLMKAADGPSNAADLK